MKGRRELCTFDPGAHRVSFQSQVSLAAQILLEAVQSFNVCNNFALVYHGERTEYGLCIAELAIHTMIVKRSSNSQSGEIKAGDCIIASTLRPARHKNVHYPGTFYFAGGPGNLEHLYKRWSDGTKKNFFVTKRVDRAMAKKKEITMMEVAQEKQTEEETEKRTKEKAGIEDSKSKDGGKKEPAKKKETKQEGQKMMEHMEFD